MAKSISTDKRLLEALDYIDRKYIAEVTDGYEILRTPGEYTPNKKKVYKAYLKFALRAACAMLIVGLLISAPTIFTNIQNMIAPGTNVIDTEPSESVSDEELLKDVKICYTSEPVSLSEEEINGIVAAHIKQGFKEYEEYFVKCYGFKDGAYAIAVINRKACDIKYRDMMLGFDIYYEGKIYNRLEATEKGLWDKKLFYEYADACLEYADCTMQIEWKETFKESTVKPYFYDDLIDAPYEIIREIAYWKLFYDYGTTNYFTSPCSVRCFFEKDDIYTFYVISPSSGNTAYARHTINGYDFYDRPGSDAMIQILCDGKIYYLNEAYEAGVIDNDYIKELYEVYSDGHWFNHATPNNELYKKIESKASN